MRRRILVTGALAAVAAVPAAVVAAGGAFGGAADRQAAKWTTAPAATKSTGWRTVPGLSLVRCTRNQVTATLSATVTGAPVLFRVVIDGVPEAPMRPGPARFVPDGTESFSSAFVARTAAFEDDDDHSFRVQWRSPTGARVTLRRGALGLLFERGRRNCG